MRSLLVFLFVVLPALAQTGRVLGTVNDESGAVIAGAIVTVTHSATNIVHTFPTDPSGNYDFPRLPVGSYLIRAEAKGFKRLQAAVLLEVGQVVRQNLRLSVGDVTETVQVEAQAPLLQADSVTIGQVVTNRQIVELPLNGRLFTSLALLVPGVTPRGGGLTMFGNAGNLSINGSRPGYENYMIEGVPTLAGNTRQPQITPSVEAIQEFKLQTSSYSAEYGRGSGSIDVITKSGTNRFHGAVYEFLRNDRLAANDFYRNQLPNPSAARPNLNRHQLGGTLGGPVVRNRTFFFLNYEGERLREGRTRTFRVPTALEKEGDFSHSPGVPAITDPTNNQPFPNLRVPVSRFHTSYPYFRDWWPTPNAANDLLIAAPAVTSNSDQGGARLDHLFSSNDSVYFRYFHSRRDTLNPGVGAQPNLLEGEIVALTSRQIVAHWTHSFSPGLLADFQYSRVNFDTTGTVGPQCFEADACTNHVVASGIQGFDFISKFYPGAPQLSFGGTWAQLLGTRDPINVAYPANSWKGDVTWIRGRHTVKSGFDFYRQDLSTRLALFARGNFSMTGSRTSGSRIPWSDFVLGQVGGGTRAVPTTLTGVDSRSYHAFIQDDWKISPRLTLNLGLRYEYNPFPTALAGGATVHLDTGKLIFADLDGDGSPKGEAQFAPGYSILVPIVQDHLIPSGALGLSTSMIDNDRLNFAPRSGLAWRPFGDKTVLRFGYGLYYQVIANGNIGEQMITQPPFSIRQQGTPGSIDAAFQPLEDLRSIASNTWTPIAFDRKQSWPYESQFSFSIQHSPVRDLLLETAYVGKTSTHLISRSRANLPASRPSFVPASTEVHNSNSTANYHSWQTRIEKRYSQGVSLSTAYTWSKSMDSSSEDRDTGGGYNRRGLSDFDIPHRLVNSFIWDLPVGHSRRWLGSSHPAADAVLGGWQLSFIASFQSGHPFHPVWAGGNTSNVNVPIAVVPDRIGSGKLDNPTPLRWFDSSAFVPHQKPRDPAAPNTFLPEEGNSGRNILRSDGMSNWDIGILKNFHFGPDRRFRLQFRAELFNAFNHVQFSIPGVNQPSFGRSAAGNSPQISGRPDDARVLAINSIPRQIQFALKLAF
jgi:hypothetical protein